MKNKVILTAFFLSGMSALIYEVVWVKPISMAFSSTIYVVSTILTSFMLGMAIGSILAGKVIDRIKKPLLAYAYLQIGIALSGLALLTFFNLLPFLFNSLMQVHEPARYTFIQFMSIFGLLLVPTTFMGATFPVMAKAYTQEKIASSIGTLYAVNNAGAIIGSILAGFTLIPGLGIKTTVIIAASINMFVALMMIITSEKNILKTLFPAVCAICIALGIYGSYNPTDLYTRGVPGFKKINFLGARKVLFYQEGLYGPVAVMQEGKSGEIKRLIVNGQGSSSLRMSDVRVSTLLGYLPLLSNPDAEKALVIGFGTGATSSILARHMKTVTAEIEPVIIKTADYFEPINAGVLENPDHSIVLQDARNYLAGSHDTFDIIVNHPLEPYQSFSSLLFTREFLEIAKKRLSNDGIYVQWYPLYNLTVEDFKDFCYTLSYVFQYQMYFTNFRKGEHGVYFIRDEYGNSRGTRYQISDNGTELIMVGSNKPIDITTLMNNYPDLNDLDIEYLMMTELQDPQRLANLYLFNGDKLKFLYRDAALITDDLPRLEFTTPLNKISGSKLNYKILNLISDITAGGIN